MNKKDAVIALNDSLQDRGNQMQVIEYESVAYQVQRDAYKAQLQKYQDTIIHLKTCYVDHSKDLGKDNIIIILRKHTTTANDRYHDLLYYVVRRQGRKTYVKLR